MPDAYVPKKSDKFTFGLWTVGNPGRDPFGDPVRPPLSPIRIVQKLAELGAYGVNLHDNDNVRVDVNRSAIPRSAPPHSLDAEQTVLGALLLDSERMIDVSPVTSPADFYDPLHRRVWSTIANRMADDAPVHAPMIVSALRPHIEQMKAGYIQVEIDQQPYEQGFLPVMQVYLEKKVGLAPADIDSGEAVFTPDQADQLMALAKQGVR